MFDLKYVESFKSRVDSLIKDDRIKDTLIIEKNPIAIQKIDLITPDNRKVDTLVTRKRGELNTFKNLVTIEDIAKDTLISEKNPGAISLKDSIRGKNARKTSLWQNAIICSSSSSRATWRIYPPLKMAALS